MTLNGFPAYPNTYSSTYCGPGALDTDGDGRKDTLDNCPFTFNPGQEDADGDGVGDVCDNCIHPNPLQLDADGDGRGDDITDTNGVVIYSCDNCKLKPNFDQTDTDSDGHGDVCDNCKDSPNPSQEDTNQNGVGNDCEGQDQGNGTQAIATKPLESYRFVGDKNYELSNHLGNVLSVITDRKLFTNTSGMFTFVPDVLSYSDYYPFGMLVPNRHGSSTAYRYGFNGKEKDDEIKGEGLQIDYGFRIYDPRIGRFLSQDPLFSGYPYYTPYQFAGNRPIWAIDLDGLEELTRTRVRVTKVNMFGIDVKQEYTNKVDGSVVAPKEEIIQQGDEGAETDVETVEYRYAGRGEFNRYVSNSVRKPAIKPNVPSSDPNDNSKEINPEPIDNPEKPVLQTKNHSDIKNDVVKSLINKVDKKVVPTPKSDNKPPIIPGMEISKNMNGLVYPQVVNDGFAFKSPSGNGDFPGRGVLSDIVKKVNKSKGVSSITVSGNVFHGSGETSVRVKAAFYTGLMKLPALLKELGLNKGVKVNVDYENTRATQSETNKGLNIKLKFN